MNDQRLRIFQKNLQFGFCTFAQDLEKLPICINLDSLFILNELIYRQVQIGNHSEKEPQTRIMFSTFKIAMGYTFGE